MSKDENDTPTNLPTDTPHHIVYRRSTHPEDTTHQLISFRLPEQYSQQNAPTTALPTVPPLPLPYSPSDYQPSPSSSKHIVISPSTSLAQQMHTNYTNNTGSRQRSRSTGNYLGDINNDYASSQRTYTMFDEDTASPRKQHYELVPYREWAVILRNEVSGSAVLYNHDSQQVSVQRYMQGALPTSTRMESSTEVNVECPLCHRPYPKADQTSSTQPTYMDRNYFRLLRSSPMQSPKTSTDNTPRTTHGSQQPVDDLFDESSSSTLHLNANAINQGYYSNFFIELRKLGRGFRGSVYLCEHILDGVKLGKYAIKKVAIGNNHTWLVKMLREVHLLERLHHPNIVNYKHSWLEYDRLTPFGPKVPCLFILMECANGGNLEEYLEPEIDSEQQQQNDGEKKSSKELKRERIERQLQQQDEYEAETQHKQPIQTQKRLLSMTEISSLFLDIVQGLAHLHQQNIVHRDLKPPNLLLKWDDRRRGSEVFKIPRVLISDFGECEDLEGAPDSDRTGATGTMEFMAPEHVRLDSHGRNTVEYSSKADMWSLGMVLYYLCYSRLPYSNVDDVDVLREEILAFKEVNFPRSRFDIFPDTTKPGLAAMIENMKRQHATDIPQEFKILIRLLLSTDPSKRPSCQEILSKLSQVTFDHHQDISSGEWKQSGTQQSPSSSPSVSSPLSTSYEASSTSAAAVIASSLSSKGNNPATSLLVERRRLSSPSVSPPSSPWSIHPTTTSPSSSQDTQRQQLDDAVNIYSSDQQIGLTHVMELDRKIRTVVLDDISNDDDMEMEYNTPRSSAKDNYQFNTKRPNTHTVELDGHYHSANGGHSTKTTTLQGVRKRQKKNDTDDTPLLLLNSPTPYYSTLVHNEQFYLHILKTITAVFKVATCTYPCLPYSTKPLILYPVILLATVDFWSEKISHSLLLLAIHLVWLISMALLTNSICMSVY
ncbi:kinase-like domain-containing protein [Chlamydoabsidia padenii]|nr:kinase-like domain-containing protein [Chlamydoabsidia padenii]